MAPPHAADDRSFLMPKETADKPEDGRQYVVLVADRMAGDIDAYGPMSRSSAQTFGSRVSVDLETVGMESVIVTVVALTESPVVRAEGTASSTSGGADESGV